MTLQENDVIIPLKQKKLIRKIYETSNHKGGNENLKEIQK